MRLRGVQSPLEPAQIDDVGTATALAAKTAARRPVICIASPEWNSSEVFVEVLDKSSRLGLNEVW